MLSLTSEEKSTLSKLTADDLRDYLFGTKDVRQNHLETPPSVNVPPQLRLDKSTIPGQNYGIIAKTWIKEGTKMGPFSGRLLSVDSLDDVTNNDNLWEIFDNTGRVSYFVDGSSASQSWISWVRCARFEAEQNLDLVQHENQIFYKANKDINPESELLVWYGTQHSLFMGIPKDGDSVVSTESTSAIQDNPEGAPNQTYAPISDVNISPWRNGRYLCVICRQGFNSRSNLRSHMRTHTMEKPFCCKYCGRKFSQSSTLRNHIRLHTGEKPYKCRICNSAYSQLAGLRAHQKSSAHRPRQVINNTASIGQHFELFKSWIGSLEKPV